MSGLVTIARCLDPGCPWHEADSHDMGAVQRSAERHTRATQHATSTTTTPEKEPRS